MMRLSFSWVGLQRFWLSDHGGVAVFFALALLPLLAGVGVSLDSARSYFVENQLQKAVDAAALAAGRITSASNTADLVAEANQVFEANFAGAKDIGASATLQPLISDGNQITMSATAVLPTLVMKLFGKDQITVRANTTIHRSMRQMELVLVMDNTGSMNSKPAGDSQKPIDAEIEGALDLVNLVFGNESQPENLYVALVPFTATVNIGAQHTDWIQPGDQIFLNPSPFKDSPLPNTFNGWKGCVMARANGLDMTDTPPTEAGGLFKSYLYPIEPTFPDNYWPPIKEPANYAQSVGYDNDATGPNLGCPPAITSLTNKKQTVVNAVKAMGPWFRGGTTISQGLAFGWSALSPRWVGLWGGETPANRPVAYDPDKIDKVVVLLSDGNNEFYDWPCYYDKTKTPPKKVCNTSDAVGKPKGSDYTAYGRLKDFNPAYNNVSDVKTVLNQRTSSMCEAMKSKGVIMYTMTFGGTPDAKTSAMFSKCATSPDFYFHAPTSTDLKKYFHVIGKQLSNLRIAK